MTPFLNGDKAREKAFNNSPLPSSVTFLAPLPGKQKDCHYHQSSPKARVSKWWSYITRVIKDTLHGIPHHINPMILDTTHTNPMDLVMHIMDIKIIHHHTRLLKMESKKCFSCYVKKWKRLGKSKNKSTIK
ncbi:hypothetical protein PIB30_056766 [Stylosanthes scabra]|uniref:Uncharacterized protein n=1 Tax=Stylosanthes scabra TaxID=79078 RepID=A0ABU6UIT9_9FABA|nr:hypothetical protein [Stylosanthes scabra]